MACFAAACLLGAAAGNSAQTILIRAAGAMVFSYFVVGLGVGALIQRTIDTHIQAYKERNPIPSNDPLSDVDNSDASAAVNPTNPVTTQMTQAST